jgi:hypothetical protein
MILPALTEVTSPLFRPINYAPFPPLGLATLAGYLEDDDEVEIQDEHVEPLRLDDRPDLVVIQAYITSAYRAYRLADHYRRRGGRRAGAGLLAGVSALLPMAINSVRCACARGWSRRVASRRLCRGLEEVRAALGRRDSREARQPDAAVARNDSGTCPGGLLAPILRRASRGPHNGPLLIGSRTWRALWQDPTVGYRARC